MERIKSLNRYQKGVLIFTAVMALVFTVIYAITISRVGYGYRGAILPQSQENGSMVYSGTVKGQQVKFTVSEDKTVWFQSGDKTFGPYTAKEDPTAIPQDVEAAEFMTGVELCLGEEVLFRGGVFEYDEYRLLYNEDGTSEDMGVFIESDGIDVDENGNEIDPVEPSAFDILDLMGEPDLIHKGEWLAWLGAVLLCVFNVLVMLFADELFRMNLAFRLRNVDQAQASDWEIAGRYIGCTILPIVAFVVFIMGLR